MSIKQKLENFKNCEFDDCPINDRSCAIMMGLIIITLSWLDGANTVYILHSGGVEVNPLMEVLMDKSMNTFILGKFLLTLFGVLTLIWFNRYTILSVLSVFYIGLMVYQFLIIGAINGTL